MTSEAFKKRYLTDAAFREERKRRALARYYRLKKERLKKKAA